MIPLPVLEEVIGRSRIAARIELLLPIGVRARQLLVRTLLPGILLVLADHRPAHLTRVHHALTALPEDDQVRPGVITGWKNGPQQLTCRQTERTFGLVVAALAKDAPDGRPSALLTAICDDLPEASIPPEHKNASTALAVDWTDLETFSRPPPAKGGGSADPRGLLGPPPQQPAGHQSRAVLRLLPAGSHHHARRARLPGPRASPPRHPHLLRPRPRPRARPRPHRAATARHPARRHPRRLRLRPPHSRNTGPCRCAPPAPSSSRTCTPTTAARTAPTKAPSSPTGTFTARARRARCWNSGRWLAARR